MALDCGDMLRAELAALRDDGGPLLPAWWRTRQQQALETLLAQGWPTPAAEDWKYTNLAPLLQRAGRTLDAGDAAARLPEAWLAAQRLPEALTLVFLDGRCVAEPEPQASWPAGLRVCSLRRALAEEHPALRAHLAQQPELAAQPLAAWSTALARDGAFVYLPRGAVLARPVHLLCCTSARAADRTVQLRSLVVAEPGSELALIESHLAAPGAEQAAALVNSVSELVLGANASATHCLQQQLGSAAAQLTTIQALQQADSRWHSLAFVLGGALLRQTIGARLAGAGAQTSLDGLFCAAGRQHVDTQTTIDHAQPGCSSRERYQGILDGAASGVFNGKIYVRPGAQQTDARQSNHNLLLSASATMNSKPQLEIFADDVKCTHGATIGQLDAEALFYLRARGLDAAAARGLLTWAFASAVVEQVPFLPLRQRLVAALQQRLGLGALGAS